MTDYLNNPLYRAVFFEDVAQLRVSFQRALALFKSGADWQGALTTMRRDVHSLKGTAAMMDLGAVSAVAAQLESVLARQLDAGSSDLPADILPAIEAGVLQIDGLLAALKNGSPAGAAHPNAGICGQASGSST